MKIKENNIVTLEFKVYDNNTNELLEDTKEVGPFFYIHGRGQFVPKVEETLEGKEKGFVTTLTLSPEEGYGEYYDELVEEMNKDEFTEFDDIYVGMDFIADMDDDTEQVFVITDIDGDIVIADGNHPFAGKNLRLEIEVIDVREATSKELESGHPIFQGFDEEECNCGNCH